MPTNQDMDTEQRAYFKGAAHAIIGTILSVAASAVIYAVVTYPPRAFIDFVRGGSNDAH